MSASAAIQGAALRLEEIGALARRHAAELMAPVQPKAAEDENEFGDDNQVRDVLFDHNFVLNSKPIESLSVAGFYPAVTSAASGSTH